MATTICPRLFFLILLMATVLPIFLLVCLFSLSKNNYNYFAGWLSAYYSFNHTIDDVSDNQTLKLPQPPSSFPPPATSLHLISPTGMSNEISFAPSPSPTPSLTSNTKKRRSLDKIEYGLAEARAAIYQAIQSRNYSSFKEETYIPRGAMYRNSYAFHQSYIEMERRFKVWVYREGEPPLVHGGPVNNIYGIEGQFIEEMHSGNGPLLARHPDEAHAFFIPISIAYIIHFLYRPLVSYNRGPLQRLIADYIGVVADKYPYWNRSMGADHFLVSCHDWAPDLSSANPKFYKYFIRILCNANTSERFVPQRDIAVPEINIRVGNLGPPFQASPPSKRSILAFFAGGAHGYIRKVLLNYWKDKDGEVRVHEYLDKKHNYFKLMGQSKFCLCPSGYEVASPRVVTAIQSGCVPVIISQNYSLPFSDVLDWKKFSVEIPLEKIPEIKTILQGISMRRYLILQRRVMKVQKHFVLNRPAKPYDMIHMVLHSVWLRRLNVKPREFI